jgi:hypothetical protein
MNAEARIEPMSIDHWQSHGWMTVPGFLGPDELDLLRNEADRLLQEKRHFDMRGGVPFSPTRSDRLDPVIDLSPSFAALAADPRVTGLAATVLGGQPQLMKDKFIAKPPGAAGYLTHQDGAYWKDLGIDFDGFLTVALFLDDAAPDQGPVECASGFHRLLLTGPNGEIDPDDSQLGPFTMIEAKAGDALLIHSLTPHRSGTNRSNRMRRALLFSYGVDDRPDLYGRYYQMRQSISS